LIRYTGRCDVHVQLPDIGPYWFRVKAYSDTTAMQTAAANWHGHSPNSWADVQGCLHTNLNPDSRYLGLMRLADEHMSPELVIHESVHVAVALARKHCGGALDLGDACSVREELVAHATDDIAGALLRSRVFTEAPKSSP
jgi:hypothetical protein